MKKLALLATAAAFGLSGAANAQDTLTFAGVTGPTGTIWNTSQGPNYALFVRTSNVGPFINPNNEVFSTGVSGDGANAFLINGEGFRPSDTVNSDTIYTLTLNFLSGNSLVGTYNSDLNSFLGGSSFTFGSSTYSLTEFSFERSLAQLVQPKVATPGGDSADYSGNFNVAAVAAAVPEPATWAMMIVGVGAVGGSMRVRRRNAKISFA